MTDRCGLTDDRPTRSAQRRPALRRNLAAALAAIGALSCGCRMLPASARTVEGAARIPSTSIDPVPLVMQGAYVHGGTGIRFPESVANFVRCESKRYDAEGNDVGIGYRGVIFDGRALARAEVTLYVFPTPLDGATGRELTFDEQVASEVGYATRGRSELRERVRNVRTATLRGREVEVRSFEWEYSDPKMNAFGAMVGLLVSVRADPWRVKYRVTLPLPARDALMTAVERLLADLDLPAIAVPHAGGGAAGPTVDGLGQPRAGDARGGALAGP